MRKITVVVKRNASYENGMYGLSYHDHPGGAAPVQPIRSEAELRQRLMEFGVTEDHANDLISRLQNKHDSVKVTVQPRTKPN